MEKEFEEGYMRGETLCSVGWTWGSLDKGEIRDLFASTAEYEKANAPVVEMYHFYGKENVLPGSTENPKQAPLNYIHNSIYAWDERADTLLEREAS